MPDLVAVLVVFVCIIWVSRHVSAVCRRTPALSASRDGILLIGALWAITGYLRGTFFFEWMLNPDTLGHEEAAREIASLLQHGHIHDALAECRLGNHAYRFLCGLFYALSSGSIACPFVINSAAAFCGLVTLLSVIARQLKARSVPAWCVLLVTLAPSPLVWCTTHLKEGLMCWALCTMLGLSTRSRLVPANGGEWVAFGIAAAFRPHIFAAWYMAMLIGMGIRRNPLVVVSAALIGACALLLLVHEYSPKLIESISEEGLTETMDHFQGSRNHLGDSVITYATGSPIPVVSGLLLIFGRPYPTEVTNLASFAAGAEYWFYSWAAICGWCSKRRWHGIPLSFACTLIAAAFILGFEFSYMYNMGLMVRYRVQAFPAIVSLAVLPYLSVHRAVTGADHRLITQAPLRVSPVILPRMIALK
jgi:hypothetical protein